MSNEGLDLRRKNLLSKRLIEQAKTHNRDLITQNLSFIFFICIVLPGILLGASLLLGKGINGLIVESPADSLYNIKTTVFSFLLTNTIFHFSIIAFIVLFMILSSAYYFFQFIMFTDKERELAVHILFTTSKNGILSYKTIKKEIVFRNLSYLYINKVVSNLIKLKHVHIEDNENPELKVIIRDSDW